MLHVYFAATPSLFSAATVTFNSHVTFSNSFTSLSVHAKKIPGLIICLYYFFRQIFIFEFSKYKNGGKHKSVYDFVQCIYIHQIHAVFINHFHHWSFGSALCQPSRNQLFMRL